MNRIGEEEVEDLCELGDISTVLSNKSNRNRVIRNNSPDKCLTGEQDKNLSTEFNSDLPEISVIERPIAKKRSTNPITNQLTGGRKAGVIERELLPDRLHPEVSSEQQSKEISLKPELTSMLQTLHRIEEHQRATQQEFNESLRQLRDQINTRKKRNRNMNSELIRVRKDLNDRKREVTMLIRVIKSGHGNIPQYHLLNLPKRSVSGEKRVRSIQKQYVSNDNGQTKQAVTSREKYKQTMLPNMPSFKTKCGSNKIFMRY